MKAFEERSPRYQRVANRVDAAGYGIARFGFGGLYMALIGLLVLGVVIAAAIGIYAAAARFFF